MSIDGQGVLTHAELVDLKAHGPIRIVVQTAGSPAGLTEKGFFLLNFIFKIIVAAGRFLAFLKSCKTRD